jgi:hypothetical protein
MNNSTLQDGLWNEFRTWQGFDFSKDWLSSSEQEQQAWQEQVDACLQPLHRMWFNFQCDTPWKPSRLIKTACCPACGWKRTIFTSLLHPKKDTYHDHQ